VQTSVNHQTFHKLLTVQISDLTIESPSIWARLKYFFNWPRNLTVSHELSRKINELLDDPNTKISIDDFYLELGKLTLWIANFPYYYGVLRYTFTKASLQSELVYREHNSPEWKEAKEELDHIYELCEKYGNKCPNSPTIWRLRQTELAARNLLTNTQPQALRPPA
jgi:hypothetical protein